MAINLKWRKISKMYYKSTRGFDDKVKSSSAIVRGIAADGGLYVPEKIPVIDRPFDNLALMEIGRAHV